MLFRSGRCTWGASAFSPAVSVARPSITEVGAQSPSGARQEKLPLTLLPRNAQPLVASSRPSSAAERGTWLKLRISGLPCSRRGQGSCGFQQPGARSEEDTYELQSLMRISYAAFCLKKK